MSTSSRTAEIRLRPLEGFNQLQLIPALTVPTHVTAKRTRVFSRDLGLSLEVPDSWIPLIAPDYISYESPDSAGDGVNPVLYISESQPDMAKHNFSDLFDGTPEGFKFIVRQPPGHIIDNSQAYATATQTIIKYEKIGNIEVGGFPAVQAYTHFFRGSGADHNEHWLWIRAGDRNIFLVLSTCCHFGAPDATLFETIVGSIILTRRLN